MARKAGSSDPREYLTEEERLQAHHRPDLHPGILRVTHTLLEDLLGLKNAGVKIVYVMMPDEKDMLMDTSRFMLIGPHLPQKPEGSFAPELDLQEILKAAEGC